MLHKIALLLFFVFSSHSHGEVLSSVAEISINDFDVQYSYDDQYGGDHYYDLTLKVNSTGRCINLDPSKMKVIVDYGKSVTTVSVVQEWVGDIQHCVGTNDRVVKARIMIPWKDRKNRTLEHTLLLTNIKNNFEGTDLRSYHQIMVNSYGESPSRRNTRVYKINQKQY